MSPEDKFVRVYKFVLAGLLIGWFIKLPAFFWKYFNEVIFDYPIHYEFFPTMFDAPFTARMFYLLPILTVVGFTLKFEKWHLTVYKAIAGIFLISSIVMMLHLASYNDATFVTSRGIKKTSALTFEDEMTKCLAIARTLHGLTEDRHERNQ